MQPTARLIRVALCLCLLLTGAGRSVHAEGETVLTLGSGHLFLPPYASERDRFGFDVAYAGVTSVNVSALGAGWYSEWRTRLDPSHASGLTYTQLIRLQAGTDPADPGQVTWLPSSAEIAQIARAHPGSLWMIGNEPDSYYHGAPLLPQTYAHVYHRLAEVILAADPNALLANGAVIQPTPCRLQYLDLVLDTYQAAYGAPLPVDVWNIHAFALREVYDDWGASTPPGIDPACGLDYAIRDSDDVDILRGNLRRFRQWLMARGENDKPLIISEYGVLWPFRPDYVFRDEDGRAFPPERVSVYMRASFDLFRTETDPAMGYAADGGRLVQAWAWYSLADDQQYNGYLFYSGSKAISPMGQAYGDYVAAVPEQARPDVALQLRVDTAPLDGLGPLAPGETVSLALAVSVLVTNIGRGAAADVRVHCPALDLDTIVSLPSRYQPGALVTLTLPPYPVTGPGLFELRCTADPELVLSDGRRWNNTDTVAVDARRLFTAHYHLHLPLVLRAR